MLPPKPFVDLTIAGKASGLFLGNALKEFVYRDVHHGEVDSISFTLADKNGLWRSSWGIDEGTEVEAVMGFRVGAQVPCGLYAIDEAEAQGDSSGDTAVFRGLAAFTSKELRTDRSAAYDKMSLKGIVAKVASRHGLKVIGEVPELTFTRISQNKENDLVFLTRLAEDWGCYFSVKGKQLVFTSRESVETAKPVRRFDLVKGDRTMQYRLTRSTTGLYPRSEAKYLNPKTKKTITATANDKRVPSGDTLKIDDRTETKKHAERLCIARLARANDRLGTGRFTLPGDPLLVAGQVVELGETFGRYNGRWLVTLGSHRFTSSGYTTQIDIKAIKDA